MDVVQLISSVYERRAIWNQNHPDHRNNFVLNKLWEEVATECNQTAKQVSLKWKNLRDYFRKELKKTSQSRTGDSGDEMVKTSSWPYFSSLMFLKDQFPSQFSQINRTSTDMETTSRMSAQDYENDEAEGAKAVLEDPLEMESSSDSLQTTTKPESTAPTSTSTMLRTVLRNRARKRVNHMDPLTEPRKRKVHYLEAKRRAVQTANLSQDENKMFFDSLLPHVRKIKPHQILKFRNDVLKIVQNYAYAQEDDSSAASNGLHDQQQLSVQSQHQTQSFYAHTPLTQQLHTQFNYEEEKKEPAGFYQ